MARDPREGRTVELEIPAGKFVERRGRSRVRIPVLTTLFHPDVRRVGERLWLSSLLSDEAVGVSRLGPGFVAPGEERGRPLADPYLSRTPFHFSPGESEGDVLLTLGRSNTVVVADGEPVTGERHFRAAELRRGVVMVWANRLVLLLHNLAPRPQKEPPRFGLVGDSEGLLRVRQEIERVADLEVPVLLRGETGTGKELIAHALHRASLRRERPFLSVNMGAIPRELAASELFGAVKGAYTGADRTRAGYFKRADRGTLFLDEVGDAPPDVQVLLLRVLDSGEIQPVGSLEKQHVDVRVLAATDADLEGAIEDGQFKAPLLHRLSGYAILMPPLRERRDDVGRLLVHFLREELARVGEEHRLELSDPTDSLWLPASIVARLARYDWPGNVRELRNLVRQLVIESRGADAIRVGPRVEAVLRQAEADAGAEDEETAEQPADDAKPRRPSYRPPSEVGDDELVEVLAENRYLIKPTAEQLGVSRSSLYSLMEKCPGVRKAVDLTREEIEASLERHEGDLEAMVDELQVSGNGLQMRMKELGIRT